MALPPTHFLTIRPGPSGGADNAFSKAITKFLLALKRRCPGRQLEYLVVNEWRHDVRHDDRHAHALIRVSSPMTRRAMRRAARAARDVAGVRCSVQRVRNVVGVANYIFKHTNRPDRKAELTPDSFRGRMHAVSKWFLTKPFKELWRDVKRDEFNKRQ